MGPLTGLRVVELGGIGPVPFAGMLLADMGAEVIRIDRTGSIEDPVPTLRRGKRSVAIDLKDPEGVALALRLIADAAVVLEGFRPGVAERLGLGPSACREVSPALVYGRMTGWGQDGALADRAGHDLNYIAVSGVLDMIGPAGGPPIIPLNLVADFGGGGMLLAVGVLAALHSATESGRGEVVDASMVEGSALLASMHYGLRSQGLWSEERGTNYLDGGAPFYNVYETSDGKYVSVAAIEPQFYARLLERLDIESEAFDQFDRSRWPEQRRHLADLFRRRTRDEWVEHFRDADACFAPVLNADEAAAHEHNRERRTFLEVGGVLQPAPAPRFSGRSAVEPAEPPPPGRDTRAVFLEAGVAIDRIEELIGAGVLGG